MSELSWYLVDKTGAQLGPLTKEAVKNTFNAGKIDLDSLCWNETMAGWESIKTTALSQYISPPKPAAPAPAPFRLPQRTAPAPAPVRAAPAAASQSVAPSRGFPAAAAAAAASAPSRGFPAATSAPQAQAAAPQRTPFAARPAAAAATTTTTAAKPVSSSAAACEWKELRTAEGQAYYYNQRTGRTQWEKPEELKTDADRERAGEWYWMPDAEEGYLPAKKIADNASKWEFETEDGKRHQLSKKEYPQLERLYWTQLREFPRDLVMLDVMSQPLILYNLRERFKRNEIYTNIGTILISINPYQFLPIYTPSVLNEYKNKGSKKLPPHVFQIADDAFCALRETGQSQSIVISGESGAGKTECTKQCLQYIAEVAGSAANNVEDRILLSNPILEAFGNAKTVRNNNSSRFGKYVEVFFDHRCQICGASNTNYLLEKIRVVQQPQGERNYHIFYQIVTGLSQQQRQQFKLLSKPEQYYYLNQSGCCEIDGVDDADEFSQTLNSMKELDFTEQEINNILQLLSAVLALGNLSFKSAGERQCVIEPSQKQHLSTVASLLGVNETNLEQAVTTRIMAVPGQKPITVGLSVEEAASARDALAKFIYEKNFDWLVDRINKSIGRPAGKLRSIGILDIFGFEIFQKNAFEQLCINFTNEKLQQFFNQHTFKLEEQLYQQEGIKYIHVTYIDNQPVLDLIEQKPNGLLPSIDEELRMPRGSDKSWLSKMMERHSSCNYFARDRGSADCFVVRHYAGDVIYDTATGFLEKNKDRLNDDAYVLIQSSFFKFLANLFPERADASSLAKKETLGSKFSRQLNELMVTLNQTEPHYIRCVKPNPWKQPLTFCGMLSLQQLQYAGVFEAVQIRKQGYPFRYTHAEFFQRYKCIFNNQQQPRWSNYMVENCKLLVQHMAAKSPNLKPENVQYGHTRVLYKSTEHREMELQRNLAVEGVTITIQKLMRIKLARLIEAKAQQIKPTLLKAIASKNIDEVEKALDLCAQLQGAVIKEQLQLQRIKHVYEEQKRLEVELVVIVQQCQAAGPHALYDRLKKNVDAADDIELFSPIAQQARQFKQQADAERAAVQQQAQEQMKVLDEKIMKEVIERADEIHYNSAEIEHLRNLLFNTSEDEFAKLQMKAAVALRDLERQIKITIKLKDLFFAKSGDMFRFPNYSRLYPAAVWADLKFGFGKEELAASFLRWTHKTIHAPLTQLASHGQTPGKNLRELAKESFKNIQIFMGDRSSGSGPNYGAVELLKNGLDYPEIRSELYCQLIKQLTQNPHHESLVRGWDLMCLMLSTFPPSSDFENYLECFLRSSQTPSNNNDRYVKLFHTTLYGGARRQAPQDHEFQQLLQAVRQEAQPAHHYSSGYSVNAKSAPQLAAFGSAPPAPRGPIPNLPKPMPQEDTKTEWYYIDKTGTQKGPVFSRTIRDEWQQGRVDAACLCWNDTMSDWAAIGSQQKLLEYISWKG